MKKLIALILLITSIFTIDLEEYKTVQSKKLDKDEEVEELKSVFVSYIELNKYIANSKEKESKQNIEKMLSNIKKMNLNSVILQVRSHADAIYNSKLFRKSIYTKQKDNDYDVLKYFIEVSKKKNIKVFAWINPYRISSSNNLNEIENKYLNKYYKKGVIHVGTGIYFNPAKDETKKLIVEGVKEVLNYQIDGLLFDDYFYPNEEIDLEDYETYLKTNKEIDLKTYRLNNVSEMVKEVSKECRKKNIYFGISPDANLENNYNKNYADIKHWLSEGYLDFIMPQIYYGFNNQTKPFEEVLEEWYNLTKEKKVDLYIALALYKSGLEDKYAGTGKTEWQERTDIISKQILKSREKKNYQGFSLFRYDNLFDKTMFNKNSLQEIKKLKKVLK